MSTVSHAMLDQWCVDKQGTQVPHAGSTTTPLTHSIYNAGPTNAAPPLYHPILQLEEVVSYFEYAFSTSGKFEYPEISHLELTAKSPAWNPLAITLLF